MYKTYALLFIFSLIGLCCCKEEIATFQDYKVDFYSSHKDFKIIEPVFEIVTEQVLVKEAYNEGAVFETVTEQTLARSAFTQYQILDSQQIHLVVNTETYTIGEVTCFDFFDEPNIIETMVPAQYKTRTFQKVTVPGTGTEIPAIYGVVESEILIAESEIITVEGEQTFNQLIFRIPEETTIQAYLADQFAQQSILNCEEGNSFRILD